MYPLRIEPWLALAAIQGQLGQRSAGLASAEKAMKLAPNVANTYNALWYAQLSLSDFDAAEATALQAQKLHFDESLSHYSRMFRAFLQGNEALAMQEVTWGASQSKYVGYLLNYGARMALSEGKVHLMLSFLDRETTVVPAGSRHLEVLQRDVPRWLAENGMIAEARKRLKKLGPVKNHTNVMMARIETGDDDGVEADLQAEEADAKKDTALRYIRVPQVRAALALAHHQPDQALAALAPAVPYDLATPRLPYLRGLVYLSANRPMQAELQFRKIIDNPGIEPIDYYHPLAHLNMARALEMEGNHATSKAEYETVLHLWKDADPDFPPMLQARAEYAKIK